MCCEPLEGQALFKRVLLGEMILNTGQRTDIIGFYSKWLLRRFEQGYVDVRNPYYPSLVTRYALDPKTVDCIGVCTKNPLPIMDHLDVFKAFPGVHWSVTITPYGKDLEPYVPDKKRGVECLIRLSKEFGVDAAFWRYDPIIVNERYTVEQHFRSFEVICGLLQGFVKTVVVSFLDIFPKVKQNYPEAKPVSIEDKHVLVKGLVEIAAKYGIRVRMCHEGEEWEQYGADCRGCLLKEDYEKVIGKKLRIPSSMKGARQGCNCILSGDIGAYSSCPHLCRYCYANSDKDQVLDNFKKHDPESSFLIGGPRPDDVLRIAKQVSWIEDVITLF